MLKLKKVQILGFKSFCDRTEVPLSGEGIAAIVGPNGCGKSNISDAITWVLGEQSAKSLRGLKMEDVIFAGTRERRPTGMAEVSITLVDPQVYDGASLAEGEEDETVAAPDVAPTPGLEGKPQDWDEKSLRAQAAAETEEAVQEAQPGTTYEAAVKAQRGSVPPGGEASGTNAASGTNEASGTNAMSAMDEVHENDVVLKVRRRKFGRSPVRAGEITVTRRLFRSGESEYLLNGKICRLRDIQDIFMGTGLGGESYAIIGQERIGQLLSSKPLDRRAVIEEAAGITRFKTKKRLAELRLEAAKTNLSRVSDIFEEVTRQIAVLKRQAAKAEKYGALRDQLRTQLRVVLGSRLRQMDADREATAAELHRLSALIQQQAGSLEQADAVHSADVERSYELDRQLRDAGARASASAVELERIAARTSSNRDRIEDLRHRLRGGEEDLAAVRAQLGVLSGELEVQQSFLRTATAEAQASRDTAGAAQASASQATRELLAAEALTENTRRAALGAMSRANAANNEIGQIEAALAGFEREQRRLEEESANARGELEVLGHQRGQIQLSFEDVAGRLKRLEAEIVDLRHTIEQKRLAETQSRRAGDQLRAEAATLNGRRSSLEALIREHSYSTDTVRNLFRASARRDSMISRDSSSGGALSPAGTLADFLEVESQYENVVDEFLRDELNYIVVKSWDAADEGMRLLQSDVAGRATFLVHPADSQATFPFTEGMQASAEPQREGVVRLKDCVRVLNGFGRSLEVILPKLREGFLTPDSATARSLALSNPQAFFLSPSGETFHNVTVTGGRPRTQGPLALKRELADVQSKLERAETELARNESGTQALGHEISALTATLDSKQHERRDTERESANSGAALRQMEAEAARISRRLQEWQLAAGRNSDQRGVREELMARKREEAERHESERAGKEAEVAELTERLGHLRLAREDLQVAASAGNAALAAIEERRRNADSNFNQTQRLAQTQAQRLAQIEASLSSAATEKARREEELAALSEQQETLTATRTAAASEVDGLTAEVTTLRSAIAELDTRLRALRHETDSLREQRSAHNAVAARLAADLEHLEASCVSELSVEASVLREDASLERIEGEALHAVEGETRALKGRMEAMGPVNMMALEEFGEASERHIFLDTQRQDLLDSIHNTEASIKEIDDVSREKFDGAFKVINENFSNTFTKLFGGGQAFMRLTDPEATGTEGKPGGKASDLSGIDIIASPPGKKLQNVLLLSGGEKALTALSLLVGIFQFQPAPFCVLDEVDAPLDEANVARFARLIAEMSSDTQFVVITHSKRTMEQADVIHGVTMQEPGVSKIVSVSFGSRGTRGNPAGGDRVDAGSRGRPGSAQAA